MRSSRKAVLFAVLVATAGLVACVSSRYSQLSDSEKARYFGTQPGYHILSPNFSVKVSGRRMWFYRLYGSGGQELIGVFYPPRFDFSNYGDRQSVYGISEDGKRLLYFNGQELASGKLNKVTGLYINDVSKGDKLITQDISSITTCVKLPKNFMVSGVKGTTFYYSTEGKKISASDRLKRLFAQGRGKEVCGPLFPNSDS